MLIISDVHGGGEGGLRSDAKVPLWLGAPSLRFLPRVGVCDMKIFDRGR